MEVEGEVVGEVVEVEGVGEVVVVEVGVVEVGVVEVEADMVDMSRPQ